MLAADRHTYWKHLCGQRCSIFLGLTKDWQSDIKIVKINLGNSPWKSWFPLLRVSPVENISIFLISSADPESIVAARLSRSEAYAALQQFQEALEDAEFCSRPEMLQRSSAEVGHYFYSNTPNTHPTLSSNIEDLPRYWQLLLCKSWAVAFTVEGIQSFSVVDNILFNIYNIHRQNVVFTVWVF